MKKTYLLVAVFAMCVLGMLATTAPAHGCDGPLRKAVREWRQNRCQQTTTTYYYSSPAPQVQYVQQASYTVPTAPVYVQPSACPNGRCPNPASGGYGVVPSWAR